MDLFGLKFSLALGAWRVRFVLMLEDAEVPPKPAAPAPTPRVATMQSLLN